MKKKYQGVVVPMVTPLTPQLKLDHGAVEKVLLNFRAHNTMPFFLGTTGESASIPFDVKQDFVKVAGKLKQEGEIYYCGVAANVLEESIELAKRSADAGIDVVAANLPSYYALTESQIFQYFETLADKSPLPVIIYNIPATTHMSIPLELIDKLSHHENIVGAKDSERSEERLQKSLELWSGRGDFSHFLGWAAQSANALLNGGDGLVPSTGNVHPGIYQEMQKAVVAGDKAKAYDMQRCSDELGAIYQGGKTLGQSLWALKVLMEQGGLCAPVVMPPLQSMDNEEKQSLINNLKAFLDKEGLKL